MREGWRTEGEEEDVWYKFLLGRTAVSKPLGKSDLCWNLQNAHKEWYLCVREVALWSQWGEAYCTWCPQDVTNQRGGKGGGGKISYFPPNVLMSLSGACLKFPGKCLVMPGEKCEIWYKGKGQCHNENHPQAEKNGLSSAVHRVWDVGVWLVIFFPLCPGRTILNPLGWEHLEGIPIPAEGKLAPDGWTKQVRGCESKVRA